MLSASRLFRIVSLIGCISFAVLAADSLHTLAHQWLDNPWFTELASLPAIAMFLFLLTCAMLSVAGGFFIYFCIGSIPIAALICAWTARNRGLSMWRYTIFGSVCAALLFVPWVYLILRMRGKRFSDETIAQAYGILFVIWSAVLAGISYGHIFGRRFGGFPWPYSHRFSEYEWTVRQIIYYLDPILVIITIGIPVWVMSRALLLRVLSNESEEDDLGRSKVSVLIRLMPFAFLMAHLFMGDRLLNVSYYRYYVALEPFFS